MSKSNLSTVFSGHTSHRSLHFDMIEREKTLLAEAIEAASHSPNGPRGEAVQREFGALPIIVVPCSLEEATALESAYFVVPRRDGHNQLLPEVGVWTTHLAMILTERTLSADAQNACTNALLKAHEAAVQLYRQHTATVQR